MRSFEDEEEADDEVDEEDESEHDVDVAKVSGCAALHVELIKNGSLLLLLAFVTPAVVN